MLKAKRTNTVGDILGLSFGISWECRDHLQGKDVECCVHLGEKHPPREFGECKAEIVR
jgi:hypothetical protein